MSKLCEFCGAYSPRSCELRDEMDGVCPWEESEPDPDLLREALEPWPMAALDADRVISRLEPRGYRLTPIEIDEAAVIRGAKALAAVFTDAGLPISSPDEGDQDDVEQERWRTAVEASLAAIRAYLEGAK